MPGRVFVFAILASAELCLGGMVYQRPARSVSLTARRPWPQNVVPYVIDSTFPESTKQKIIAAMEEWHQWTCVRFKPAQANQVTVKITPSTIPTECVTPVGYIGIDSMVKLGAQCTENSRSIIHELGHVLGLDHEHQHPDRGTQLTMFVQNVNLEMQQFFDVFPRDTSNTFNRPYDPLSIMHYRNDAFSSNGKPTMVHNNRMINAVMGWTDHPSSLSDIPAVRQIYGCPQNDSLPRYGVECKDNDPNCARVGPSICTSLPGWAPSVCLLTCGLCTNAGEIIVPASDSSVLVQRTSSSCREEQSCDSSACTGALAAWATVNCRCTCPSQTVNTVLWAITVGQSTASPTVQAGPHNSSSGSNWMKASITRQLSTAFITVWMYRHLPSAPAMRD